MDDPMFGHGGHMPDGVIAVGLFLLGLWVVIRTLDKIEDAIKRRLQARRDRGLPPSTKI